jgi:nucleoid-associated protein YgaU
VTTTRRTARGGALAACGLALLAGGSGCTTYWQRQDEQEARRQEDYLLLKEDLTRLAGRVDGLAIETERLRAELDGLRRQGDTRQDAQVRALQARMEELDRRIGAVDAARAKDRQETIDALSAKVAELMKRSGGSGGAAKPLRKAGGEFGYEHTVKQGESLSVIAAAYGVKVSAIQEANGIRDPRLLRAGQVLFIPEP